MKISSPKVATLTSDARVLSPGPAVPLCRSLSALTVTAMGCCKGDFNPSHSMAMHFQTRAAGAWEEDMEKAGKKI